MKFKLDTAFFLTAEIRNTGMTGYCLGKRNFLTNLSQLLTNTAVTEIGQLHKGLGMKSLSNRSIFPVGQKTITYGSCDSDQHPAVEVETLDQCISAASIFYHLAVPLCPLPRMGNGDRDVSQLVIEYR